MYEKVVGVGVGTDPPVELEPVDDGGSGTVEFEPVDDGGLDVVDAQLK